MTKKITFFLLFSLFFFLLSFKAALADTLTNASDTISNSRPSAISTIGVGASAGAVKLTLANMNTAPFSNARYIASDSAVLLGGPGTQETIQIASMSAIAGTTAALYTISPTTQNHNIGATVMMASTAQHTIQFKTVQAVDSGGKIEIVLPPGNTANPNFPSYNGFSFNGLTSAQLSANGATCGSWTITSATGTILCTLSSALPAATAVTINIGLNNTSPVLVNPAKTNTVGSEDSWTITLKTYDSAGTVKDFAKVRIATIEAVEVYATVDPYINFTIQGINNNVSIGTSNAGCTDTGTTNSGFDSSSTTVNLGVLGAGRINLAAQLLTITTNANNGYTLTATSSGHLIDPAVGYWLSDAQGNPTNNNTPTPAALTAGNTAFGLHPCGQDVYYVSTPGDFWGSGATGGGTGAKYANPSPTYYYTLARDTTGPIGSGSADGSNDGLVTVVYAGTISNIVPAGNYHTVITYVATATF